MRRFRWLMAMCLAMLLVCGLVGGVPSAQAAPFAGGSGTEGEPYLIETAGQLNEVRNYLDNHFKLNASINLAVYGSDYDSGRGWEPIGTSGNPFTGSVHGAVYTVSDLYIDREDDYTGLFGYLNGAVIESIVLKDIHVTGSKYVGGLAGYAQDSDVSDSHSEGVIEAFKFAGGLAGVVNGTDICNSSAGVNIAGYNSIGGLLGQVAGGTCNIINSYAAGDVVADSMYIGGLIGIVESADTEIVNSYAMGNVWSGGNGHLGGLVGSFGGAKITNSYAAGKVESQDTPVGGLVGNNYSGEITGSFYDTDTSGQSDTGKGEPKSTLEMIQEATFTGWDFNTVWLIEEGLSYPYLKDNRQDPKPVPPELFAGGNGEAATPFLIETPEHLDNVRIYLGSEHANKHFKLMGNIDLGVSPWNTGEGWEPIGINESSFTGSFDGNGYTISNLFINRANTNYVGLFGYAEGAEFSDMKLEGVNVTGGSGVGGLVGFVYEGSIAGSLTTGGVKGNYQVGGLVGRASDCTIEDSLADSTVICGNYNGHSRVGGLVGEASNMMITNCHAMGEVTGQGLEVGGLVGRGDGSTITSCYATVTVMSSGNRVGGLLGYEGSSFEVLDCHANGSVTGNDYVGGLVGINYGRISSSFATGDVTGRNYVGGLAGYNNWGGNNEIVNSYATGPVTGNDKVGGLAGYNFVGLIGNSYAAGKVNGSTNTGGLLGENSNGTVTASFYDRETTFQNDTGKGEPKTTQEMQSFSTFTGWNFSELWILQEGVTYPLLRWQDEAVGITVDVNGVVLNHNVLNLTMGGATATLTATVSPAYATNRDVTWSSSDTEVASVDNGVVTPVAEGTATITVTTVDGGFTAECTVIVIPEKTPVFSDLTVTGTSPGDGATGVSRTPTITVTFSEDIEAGTNYGNITLQSTGDSVNISKSISSDILTITPEDNLAYKTSYTLTIPVDAVKGVATGANMDDAYEFRFITRSKPSGGGGGGWSPTPSPDPEFEPEPETEEEAGEPELEIKMTIGELQASVGGAPYTLDVPAYIKSGSNRTLVPIRFVAEALGAEVEWLAQTRQVLIKQNIDGNQLEIVLTLGSDSAGINGEPVTLDCPAETQPPGRTFIPLRFVGETLGAQVDWDADTQNITITR